jgi:hypothetical protein
VEATCSEGLTSADFSDAAFIIKNTHNLSLPVVIYPNGGEILEGIVIIRWLNATDSLGDNVSYAVYFSDNDGASWNLLESGLIANSYSWNSTILPDGTSYLIKVEATCSDGLTSADFSDAAFTLRNIHKLSLPVIVYPNGGEILNGTVIIQWMNVTDPLGHLVAYKVYYSDNYGALWTQLALGLITTSYFWDTATIPDGTSYLIKVEAVCSEGLTSEDTSDASFTIQNAELPPSSSKTTTHSAIIQSKDDNRSVLSPGYTISALIGSFSLLLFRRLRKPRDFS